MKSFTGPRAALTLLLAINLFNYIDRYILAAVLPTLKHEFLAGDPNQNGKAGLWTTAFLVTYMCAAPLFGWLADRFSRWLLIGISVAVWSLASGWSGLAMSFGMLLFTRVFVGIGEAGYGPAAPTIIADMYPIQKRGKVLAWFYAAIPVGSALGYMFGGSIADHLGWRWAFYLVVPPGLLLGALCVMMRDPRTMAKERAARRRPTMADYRRLLRIPSYLINTAAMTVMTFAIGGFSAWLPDYIFHDRRDELSPGSDSLGNIDFTFGAITASAGLIATVLGGWTGDKLREKFPSSYFLISGIGMLLAFPATLGVIYLPFPGAWVMIFLAVFFLFFNTGPSNTALANVSPPMVRATAYALNILIIHLLGDAISPPLIGVVRDRWNMDVALAGVSVMMLAAGALWFWGTRFLGRDTAAIEIAEARAGVSGA
ncbi:MAG TPA: MFS transporter [Chthoniobacterales bacterium]|nr:MFS transporter [Chthoniobacterales bacterium]